MDDNLDPILGDTEEAPEKEGGVDFDIEEESDDEIDADLDEVEE